MKEKTTAERREELAKLAEEKGIPNLATVLRDEKVQKVCDDITVYEGWIRISTDIPDNTDDVLITNGKSVWIGNYNSNRNSEDKWAVVYDGDPPFKSHNIIAWKYMPHIPSKLSKEVES